MFKKRISFFIYIEKYNNRPIIKKIINMPVDLWTSENVNKENRELRAFLYWQKKGDTMHE